MTASVIVMKIKYHGSLNSSSGNRKRKDEWKSHTIAKALFVSIKQVRSVNVVISHSIILRKVSDSSEKLR
jgi:hypothetical protein